MKITLNNRQIPVTAAVRLIKKRQKVLDDETHKESVSYLAGHAIHSQARWFVDESLTSLKSYIVHFMP